MDFCLRFAPLTILICITLNLRAQTNDYSLAKAEKLFNQYDVPGNRNVYDHIAADKSRPVAERTKAYLSLATVDWRFYRNYPSAHEVIDEAEQLKTDLLGCHLLSANINREYGLYAASLTDARWCLRQATTATEKIDARLAFARTVDEEGFYRVGQKESIDIAGLKQAAQLLNEVLEKQPGNSEASETMAGIGLLLKDGKIMLRGLKSYYLISNESDVNGAIAPGFTLLKPLGNWRGETLNERRLTNLAKGLAGMKFFDAADVIIQRIKTKHPHAYQTDRELRDIDAYAAYIRRIKKVSDSIYPKVALGLKHYEDKYDSLMDVPGKAVWKKLSFISKNEKYDPDTLYNVLNRRYGMEGYSGTTVGYYGMLMGHIIHKERKQISQYGYNTNFTYISVDRLISRDFTSWYGTTNVGGWGDSTTIIQVRKAYMTEPFDELSWMTDSTARHTILAKIAAAKQADYVRCERDPYAEPKFLAPYLKYNEASKVYKHLVASGLRGMELNIAFINEILKLTVASTVFAHEGRHAIDQLYFPQEFKKMSDDERELRAKYSEVIYSLDPKMAFTGSIFGSDLAENTNHGKANKRFRKLIVDWMTAHEQEIKGLDKKVPLLMQFDLLTDAQLIAICKSGDPLAQKTGK